MLKMTKKEQERAAEAAAATSELSDEERAEQVMQVAAKVAKDVDDAKPEAKKPETKKRTPKSNTRPNPKPVPTKTPGREMMSPTRTEHQPLQGVTVDPDENYPKILHVVVSVGEKDERSMDEFIEDVKDALLSKADAKLATVLLSKYAIEGKHILAHHYDAEVARLRPEEEEPADADE